jgi:hypothetical protein
LIVLTIIFLWVTEGIYPMFIKINVSIKSINNLIFLIEYR